MKTINEIAQWVIDNRYPKSEHEKVTDFEMYNELVESIAKLCNTPRVSKSVEPVREDTVCIYCKGKLMPYNVCLDCNELFNIPRQTVC